MIGSTQTNLVAKTGTFLVEITTECAETEFVEAGLNFGYDIDYIIDSDRITMYYTSKRQKVCKGVSYQLRL